MSNTRIRYDDDGNNRLTSRRRFLTASGQEVLVEILKDSNSYLVKTTEQLPVVLASGTQVSVNLSVVKIKAKEALMGLGVMFEDEERDRSSIEVEQQGRPVGLE